MDIGLVSLGSYAVPTVLSSFSAAHSNLKIHMSGHFSIIHNSLTTCCYHSSGTKLHLYEGIES
ncbi:hypothetical protein EMPG_10697 [Blastomyces silverae]|uniref:Uncharacterized protein n=1 Tax=Blastomyces silverae TaxID=2060906 RepID=A0A0H1B4G0_9EURO|nr:hypothetical protein EMPG_10697 [Blastomyces silverae]